MLKTLKTFNYHKELIETLLKAKTAGVATNVIAPILFFLVFDDIPLTILYTWMALHFVVFIFRIAIGNRLLKNLYIYDDSKVKAQLKIYLLVFFVSSLLWGIMTPLVVMYTDDLHIFILISILIAIVSGAVSTVGSVYHAIFIYIVTILPPFILSLAIFGDSTLHYAASLFLLVYFCVLLTASYRNYKMFEKNISQREKIECLNISLNKDVEKAIQDTKHKEKIIQQQSRPAQMGEMISMIAHQWRQPLGSIGSIVNNIQVKIAMNAFNLQKNSAQDEFMEFLTNSNNKINDNVQFLSATINDFRNFFKPDKEKELVCLAATIDKALQIVLATLKSENIEVTTDFQANSKIMIYQNELIQVVLNIVKNSEDNFLDKKVANAKIEIKTNEKENDLYIYISDNGGGVPEEILGNIFDPYFSTKDEMNGTGLGLYMSKIMIEEHMGGTLSARNTSDGVVFEIKLSHKMNLDHYVI